MWDIVGKVGGVGGRLQGNDFSPYGRNVEIPHGKFRRREPLNLILRQ